MVQGRHKNTPPQVLAAIKLRWEANVSLSLISREFDLHRKTIEGIAGRRGWKRDISAAARATGDQVLAEMLTVHPASHHGATCSSPQACNCMPAFCGDGGCGEDAVAHARVPNDAKLGETAQNISYDAASNGKLGSLRSASPQAFATDVTARLTAGSALNAVQEARQGPPQQPGQTGGEGMSDNLQVLAGNARPISMGPTKPIADGIKLGSARHRTSEVIDFPVVAEVRRFMGRLRGPSVRLEIAEESGPSEGDRIRTQVALATYRNLMSAHQIRALDRTRDVLNGMTAAFNAYLDPGAVVDQLEGSNDWSDEQRLDAQSQVAAAALAKLTPTPRDTLSGTLKVMTEALFRGIQLQREVAGIPVPQSESSVSPPLKMSQAEAKALVDSMSIADLQAVNRVIRAIEGQTTHRQLPIPPPPT